MSGLKIKRLIWTIVFLGITLAAIVMECVAGLLHPAGTIPWTEYLARYVPWPIQLVAYVALTVWLPFHFWRHDHMRKIAYRQGCIDGRRQGWSEARKAYGGPFQSGGVLRDVLMPGEKIELGPWPDQAKPPGDAGA